MKYLRVYTVGCFDYCHHGHRVLFERMRELGHQIIAGIHDDASLQRLKNLSPTGHQPLAIRIKSIRPYVDQIFVIPDTDPSLYLESAILTADLNTAEPQASLACYARGNDMPNFPGKQVVEGHMPIILLPYTCGISSTQIRARSNSGLPTSS